MIRCPKCGRYSGDAAVLCSNCGYPFEKNRVNSSMSKNKSDVRDNVKTEQIFKNREQENNYHENDDMTQSATQSFYYQSNYNEESINTKEQEKEKAREAIEKIKMQNRQAQEKVQKEKNTFKRNAMKKNIAKNPLAIVGLIFFVILIIVFGKFLLGNTFVSEKNLYGRWSAISCVDLDGNGGEFIHNVEEYIFEFYESGKGYMYYEMIDEDEDSGGFLWKMNGNHVSIYSIDDEDYLTPINILIELKRKKLIVNMNNDYQITLKKINS